MLFFLFFFDVGIPMAVPCMHSLSHLLRVTYPICSVLFSLSPSLCISVFFLCWYRYPYGCSMYALSLSLVMCNLSYLFCSLSLSLSLSLCLSLKAIDVMLFMLVSILSLWLLHIHVCLCSVCVCMCVCVCLSLSLNPRCYVGIPVAVTYISHLLRVAYPIHSNFAFLLSV